MVERMQFISILGQPQALKDMLENHISKYEIHLESPGKVKDFQNVRPVNISNPYRQTLEQLKPYLEQLESHKLSVQKRKKHIFDGISEVMEYSKAKLKELNKNSLRLEGFLDRRAYLSRMRDEISAFDGLDFDVSDIIKFKHIKYRFGSIPLDFFKKYEKHVLDNGKAILISCPPVNGYVRAVYFCLVENVTEVDNMFASLHFQRYYMPDEVAGRPGDIVKNLDAEILRLDESIKTVEGEQLKLLTESCMEITDAYDYLMRFDRMYDAVPSIAQAEIEGEQKYIISGWVSIRDSKRLGEEVKAIPHTLYLTEDNMKSPLDSPPTKLNNPKLFAPFEALIKMYGVPSYNEIDPTIFVALTYPLIFGAMFGDVGQGAVLLALGLFLFFRYRITLGAVLSFSGAFATIFGFLYGSVFGFEELIHAVWLKPIKAMQQLPILGNLNTVFITAIIFGMFLIITAMIFNIINCIKAKNLGGLITGHNAITGLVFYATAVCILVIVMSGNAISRTVELVLLIVLLAALGIFMLKEPLSAALEKKKYHLHGSIAMYIVENFFEVFEILLSFFSNTLSFVRIGAFAVSHAAMMEVVMMLSGADHSGHGGNIFGIILGNAFICAMEGLIVGIQVLRLEYYEMFSRFYTGSGKEFKPFFIKDNLGGLRK